MSTRALRPRPRINYHEPEEPSFDEYIYCERCSDYVLEYCAIHGPLLVIPDDKVPSTRKFPSVVPHAALTIPHVFLHLAPSVIPGAGIGVFSTLTLPCGVRFGPYVGDRTDSVDSSYCWQIYDRNNRPSHVLDAVDPNNSNWLRYVNCSRHRVEQNLIAYQYRGQLYYRTIKIIPRFTELLVFYGSEFANALRVNLAKYNDIPYYKQIINPTKKDAGVTSRTSQYTLMGNDGTISQKLNHNYELNMNNFLIIDNPIITINEHVSEQNLVDFAEKDVLTKNLVDFIDASKKVFKDKSHFQCEHCSKSFSRKQYLKTHLLSHLPPKYICSKCSYGTSISHRFKRHLSIHGNQNVLITDICEESNKKNLNHRFQCDQCNKSYKYKDGLRIHILSHLPTPKYQCSKCSYNTSISYRLKTHILVHSKQNREENLDQRFQCDHCNKLFKRKDYIRTHMLSHLPTPKYQCPKCSYGTSLSYRFKIHILNHTKQNILDITNTSETILNNLDQIFKCEHCNKCFLIKKNLERHLLSHIKTPEYQCPKCSYSTSKRYRYNKHYLTHSKRVYSCDMCPFTTKIMKNFITHSSSNVPKQCDICPYSTCSRKSFRDHIRKHKCTIISMPNM